MPNKTDSLKLNQWEGSDAVLHTDFNEDNVKIDQAVQDLNQTADATASRLEALRSKGQTDYEFLSFALLNALTLTNLESYYPGNKRGLVYDSFTSTGKMGIVDQGVHVLPDKRYLGMGKAVDEPAHAAGTQSSLHSIAPNVPWQHFFKQECCGYLKGFTLFCNLGSSATLTIRISRANKSHNQVGQQISSETITRSFIGYAAQQALTFTPVYLTPGDYVIELIPTKYIDVTRPLHTFAYDSCAKTSGVFNSIVFPFSNFGDGQVKARVTHDVGTVSVILVGSSGARFAMTRVSTGTGINQNGESCIMSEFSLANSSGLGTSVKVELTLSSPTEKSMRVYDYGVIFI